MDPSTWDHDACGVGLIADRRGRASHEWLARALDALVRLTHRGATGDGPRSADGAGILAAIPWTLVAPDLPAAFREPGQARAAGAAFVPPGSDREVRRVIADALEDEGWGQISWRPVPFDPAPLGAAERATRPDVWQVFALHQASPLWPEARLERSLFRARVAAEARLAEARLGDACLISLSRRTMLYKALIAPAGLPVVYPDLADARYDTTFAVFHQRFSTNTFPCWPLAQPFRVLAHNGEINTILGNRLHARRRQADAAAGLDDGSGGAHVRMAGSDSQSLDDMVDSLRQAGFSLAHAFARLLPRAWEHDASLASRERAFEAWQAAAAEPWEGPAGIAFSDGRQAGAVLDRNGFRPLRVLASRDGMVCVGSESGIFDVPEPEVERRSRLGPGEMIVVDLESGRLLENGGLRRALAAQHPYGEWAARTIVEVRKGTVPSSEHDPADKGTIPFFQHLFGYTAEELEVILRPMVEEGKEAVGSMGDDTPLAVLGGRRRPLSDYFRQRFAQVTNPPIDPLREQIVMSLRTVLGRRPRLLDESDAGARLIALDSPILTAAQLRAIRHVDERPAVVIATTYDAAGAEGAFEAALARVVADALTAVRAGAVLIVLSDEDVSAGRAPLPMLLAVSMVDVALGRAGLGTRASLVCAAGEVRDAHQAAALLAFGAAAVHPWLAFQSARLLSGRAGLPAPQAAEQFGRALEHGLLKVMSKMGVCTIAGYQGSHLMEVIGLDRALLDAAFPDTAAVAGSLSLEQLARESVAWHQRASRSAIVPLPHPGVHGFRRDGDYHANHPALIRQFHRAVDDGSPDAYRQFAALVLERPPTAVRDLLEFRDRTAVALDEVEPADAITRRFFASAMSVGALGPDAHRVLAEAMNAIGARSNSGEGGEEPERFGQRTNSATKQVASARFGVTPAYLLSASELQIKMAQGSKPGEGGQLPAAKVVDHIARLRHAQPGTPLISPPPHHDIYSIEDLAQLIYDLRAFHPGVRINVKLVATSGIGIIAAGVVKAGADAIQISGHDGGTGASPRGSIKHAGLPWELGLNDAHRVLLARGSRARVVLQTDGGLKTGRDVAMAAALGAQEYGFGTSVLIAIGCVMARQCHLNTCPVGIATQRADLRAKFAGTAEQVITYLRLVAEDVRRVLASLGLRSLDELVGRTDLLQARAGVSQRLDLSGILSAQGKPEGLPPHSPSMEDSCGGKPSGLPNQPTLNQRIVACASRSLGRHPTVIRETVRNTDRTVGATLAGVIAREAGDAGIPDTPVRLELTGHAGQSLGAFGLPGLDIYLTGDANDGVGKGLHGGTIAIRPPAHTPLDDQALVGNAALYGATGGSLFIAGRAGERFAVRNSGATAVVEGAGHHACEYMTGGMVVVLGPVGPNFAAGMTGGVAYVHDPDGQVGRVLNAELVAADAAGEDDEARLAGLLADHLEATGSRRAAALLEAWPRAVSEFTRIVPKSQRDRVETHRADSAQHPALHARPGGVAPAAGAAHAG